MANLNTFFTFIISVLLISGCFSTAENNKDNTPWQWQEITANGKPTARHEAGLASVGSKIYLMGGRRINPTSIFDTADNTWYQGAATPIELHHFQPVTYKEKIYIIGALTGQWPNETPVDRVIIYDPKLDTYQWGDEIPQHRRRGGAGVVVRDSKFYILGGIVNGHMDGYKPWFDEYDPATGEWKTLPDAPQARDHFQAVTLNNKLYAFAGRKTSKRTNQDMALTLDYGDIYDFEKQIWLQTTTLNKLPTTRAGNGAFVWNNHVVIGGGESTKHLLAHNEIEAFNPANNTWTTWPSLQKGRHGTGFVIIDGFVYTASGAGHRGGEPELLSIERLKLPTQLESPALAPTSAVNQTALPVHKKWHTVTLNFTGPEVTEKDQHNPFLHYQLRVDLTHEDSKRAVSLPGYFAADGNAENSGADKGDQWQVKFNPPEEGVWHYQATFYSGENIAVAEDLSAAKTLPLIPSKGQFLVIETDKIGKDFKAQGRLVTKDSFFYFPSSNKYWLKGGTNSPENLLAYEDFDNTYRVAAKAREGEAAPVEALHHYETHKKDWQTGDPLWGDKKGTALIGGINYLAAMGMNSAYFLTMNIGGDGHDVWPYITHQDFTRFDVSKLAQWELVFEHMQAKGMLLHMVIQETENERLLDDGDTGLLRKLYLNELIARFGHHLGLVWNLGEENGYAKWSPHAQNTEQRKAMATHIKARDVFQHPVLLHTHSHDPDRENILKPLLGFKAIDGLSLQADKRETVAQVIQRWKTLSRESGHQWLITMDEIGLWHTAALPDSVDDQHDSLRRHALWGSLFSGGAGVEWYFGAKHPHNDLTSEDWRQREQLWRQTEIAKQFVNQHLPYWQMNPCTQVFAEKTAGYCVQKNDELIALYFIDGYVSRIALAELLLSATENQDKTYDIHWFNPKQGGELQKGSVLTINTNVPSDIGTPPTQTGDWVVLLKKRSD